MFRKTILAFASLTALASCTTMPGVSPPSLDVIARQYLALQLAIGEKDPGYVDAYYGPPELAEQAAANDAQTTLPMLQARVVALEGTLRLVNPAPGTPDAARVRYLRAMLNSAKVRLRVLRGEDIPFQDEAEGLFGVRPELVDLSTLDAVLERIEAVVPGDAGDGPLYQRINAFQDRFIIPEDRLREVIDTAVAECRRRTLEHVDLPASESFVLSLVTDKPWGGFNYYQGNYRSVIEINTDLPTRLDRAVDVGCHEAYPGHHVYSTLIERDLTRGRGWIENSLLPLYSPRAIISEGSARYAKTMVFPGDEKMVFERDVLAPMAGIDTGELADYVALNALLGELQPAYYTIAAGYLDGDMSREETIDLSMRYRLLNRERAEQSLRFFDTYRSYVINYGMGEDLVAAHVEAAGADMDARWDRFTAILNSPTLPEDLR
ncbi:hypothetical protein [Aurantiacibacter gilvus]|uniref:DUF885 domain-containing protein n=1 Tax=Aurantiacibacter gilvus TaxID=3139141 RepID=A0ABU9IDX8_9SPHN